MPLSTASLDWFFQWIQLPTWQLAGLIFLNILWIPLFIIMLKELWEAFQFWTSGMYSVSKRKFIYLAIDVPREAEQTPAAMEAIFNQLAGSHGSTTWWETKWKGEFQEWFSFEIVSLDGYVQYIIRTHVAFRDLVEASIYAQYSDAEISEVTDYTQDIPSEYPDDEWDFFGTEYILKKENAYPIRTYNEFEDKIRGELVDPMSALLEIMSKMDKGEQIWFQLLIKPVVDKDWVPEAEKVINKIIDRKNAPEKAKGFLGFFGTIFFTIHEIVESILGGELAAVESRDELAKSPMFKLTPGERTILEDMERKTGKIAYKSIIRIAYLGKKDVYNKARGVGPVIGAIKQFNDASKNWFTITKKSWTKANYSFKNARKYLRQNAFYKAYSGRSMTAAESSGGYILNSEELATIYHFPMASVKAPLVKRTGARKTEPPPTLPIEEVEGEGSTIIIHTRPEPPSAPESLAEKAEKESKPESLVELDEDKTNIEGLTTPSESEVQFIDFSETPPVDEDSDDEETTEDPPKNLPVA